MHLPTYSNPPEYDDPQFLEPAHHHDPARVSNIAAIPADILKSLPPEAQQSLLAIQESTSVAFASHLRLQDLLREKFGRLVPAKDQVHDAESSVKYSEPAWSNYVNQLRNEKEYLLEEAFCDFRHKALRIDFCGHHNTRIPSTISSKASTSPNASTSATKTITLLKWWSGLQDTVDKWAEDAEDAEIPSFKEAVEEYKAFQEKEIRKRDAREERNRRRKTILDLEGRGSELDLTRLASGLRI